MSAAAPESASATFIAAQVATTDATDAAAKGKIKNERRSKNDKRFSAIDETSSSQLLSMTRTTTESKNTSESPFVDASDIDIKYKNKRKNKEKRKRQDTIVIADNTNSHATQAVAASEIIKRQVKQDDIAANNIDAATGDSESKGANRNNNRRDKKSFKPSPGDATPQLLTKVATSAQSAAEALEANSADAGNRGDKRRNKNRMTNQSKRSNSRAVEATSSSVGQLTK